MGKRFLRCCFFPPPQTGAWRRWVAEPFPSRRLFSSLQTPSPFLPHAPVAETSLRFPPPSPGTSCPSAGHAGLFPRSGHRRAHPLVPLRRSLLFPVAFPICSRCAPNPFRLSLPTHHRPTRFFSPHGLFFLLIENDLSSPLTSTPPP